MKGERATSPQAGEEEKRKGKKVGGCWPSYDRAWVYRIPWESAICTAYPLGYVVVLIRSRSPTTIVVPPVPTNWTLLITTTPSGLTTSAVKLTITTSGGLTSLS